MHHPLIISCSLNFEFYLIDSFEIIEKCFRVLGKMINVSTNMNLHDKLPLSKTDIIYDNMLSLAAFVSKVMATSIMYIPSGSKLKQPQMSKIFDEPIFQAVDFQRTKNVEDNVSNNDIHESSEFMKHFVSTFLA